MVTTRRERDTTATVREGYERAEAPRGYDRQTVSVSNDDRFAEYRDYDGAYTAETETYAPAVTYEPERAEPAIKRYHDEDLMPTYRTMRLKDTSSDKLREREKARKSEPAKQKGMSGTAKMMIAVYALILVIAVVLIIATSVAAANKSNQAAALGAQSAALQAQIVQQDDQIAALQQGPTANDPRLAGYTQITSTVSIQLLPLQAPTAYQAQAGWFEGLCRLFSR